MSVRGYAIKANGEIDVRTVSPSETGAMINWLFVHVGGRMAWLNDDDAIRESFALHPHLTCIRVNIEETP